MKILMSVQKQFKVIFNSICLLSLIVGQNTLNAQQCDNCCEDEECLTKKKGLIIGGVAAAVGIGAAAIFASQNRHGHGHGHSGKDGSRGSSGGTGSRGSRGLDGATGPMGPIGPQGPEGPGFIADLGQTLTFTLTALFPAVVAGSLTALPFVTTPDGVTFEGTAITTPTAGGTVIFDPIIIPNPVFGFYSFGLSIINTSVTTLTGITLNNTIVAASRDSSNTIQLTPVAGVTISPGETQVSNTFTYDPANVP